MKLRRGPLTIIVLLVLLYVVGTVKFWYWPLYALQQAEESLTSDPERSARLAQSAHESTWGGFPLAQVVWTRALLRTGDWEAALECFQEIRQPQTLPWEVLRELAAEAEQVGFLLLARVVLEAVPADSDSVVTARLRLIQLHARLGALPEAHRVATDLSNLAPEQPIVWYWLARIQDQSTDPLGAFAAYQTCLSRLTTARDAEPPLPGDLAESEELLVRQRIVQLAIDLGELETARNSLSDWQQQLQTSPEYHLLQAQLLRQEGETDAAWQSVERYLTELPDDLHARTLRAMLAVDRGEAALAETEFKTILARAPQNKTVHYQLALLLERQQRREEAARHFDENRRLTELSVRIIELQAEISEASEPSRAQLEELAELYEQFGRPDLIQNIRLHLLQRNN